MDNSCDMPEPKAAVCEEPQSKADKDSKDKKDKADKSDKKENKKKAKDDKDKKSLSQIHLKSQRMKSQNQT
ncbi:UNVERIFIED_ORG: hypothetical protein [Escherichia phage CMSTMSU]